MGKVIVGWVRDNPGGAPLAGKSVTLKDAATDLSVATGGQVNLATNPVTSDAFGKFSFTMDLSPGPVYVDADLGGGSHRFRYGAEVMQAGSLFIGELSTLFQAIQTGVLSGILNEFTTTASGVDRTVTTQPGYALIKGLPFGWDSGNKALVGSAYGGAGTRYDYLVLRQWYGGASTGKQQMLIVEGTNVTDPPVTSVESDLTKFIQGANIYDLPIKRIKTPTGSSTVTLDNLVGTTLCPYATVRDNTISTVKLQDLAVTTAKLADANVTNAKVAAGIDAAKLADGSVSNAELQFIGSVTSDVQTQIDGKQPLDATLTSLAALDATAGLLTETAADTFVRRSLAATGSGLTWTNANGAAGNPSLALATVLSNIAATGLGFLSDYFSFAVSQDSSDFTNTDTATPTDAVSTTITLPAGTWTIFGLGGYTGYHSATVSTPRARIMLDGTSGGDVSITGVPQGDRFTLVGVCSKASVAGGGAKTVKVQFYSPTAGTVTADSSWIVAIAFRTS